MDELPEGVVHFRYNRTAKQLVVGGFNKTLPRTTIPLTVDEIAVIESLIETAKKSTPNHLRPGYEIHDAY